MPLQFKKHQFAILFLFFLLSSKQVALGIGGQVLTIKNDTGYNAALVFQLSSDYYTEPYNDEPFEVIPPHTTTPPSTYRAKWIGVEKEGYGNRKAKFSLWKKSDKSDLISKEFEYSGKENVGPITWDPRIVTQTTQNTLSGGPSTTVETRVIFKISVNLSNRKLWMSLPKVFYSDYTFIITEEQIKVTDVKQLTPPPLQPKKGINLNIDENQGVYEDVLINFHNTSKIPLDIVIEGHHVPLKEGGVEENFKLHSNKKDLPLRIYVQDNPKPAEFSEGHDTISKILPQPLTKTQDFGDKGGKPTHTVKLKVTPSYSEKSEGFHLFPSKEKSQSVKYDIEVHVEPK